MNAGQVDLPPQIRQRTVAKARTLLEALPFMREHHGRVIVVKIGGAAMDAATLPRNLASSFAEDISLLQSAGITSVVVHGGGPQVTTLSERLGIETAFVDGLRVTDAEVRVRVRLGDGHGSSRAYGCDLGYEYVRINGEYTT